VALRVVNKLYGTSPLFVHAPGNPVRSPLWEPILAAMPKTPTTYRRPEGVTFVTWNSGGANARLRRFGRGLGRFEWSAALFGQEVVTLGADRGEGWTNAMKLETTCEFLVRCPTPYVMAADSSDAVMVADPADLVKRFESMGCDMVFNGETEPWPPEAVEARAFEDRVHRPPFRHLNGGLWMGRSQFCLDFFRAARAARAAIREWPTSEQVALKAVYPVYHPRAKVDDGCDLFQVLLNVGEDVVGYRPKVFM
jgi:hypothetical protein